MLQVNTQLSKNSAFVMGLWSQVGIAGWKLARLVLADRLAGAKPLHHPTLLPSLWA